MLREGSTVELRYNEALHNADAAIMNDIPHPGKYVIRTKFSQTESLSVTSLYWGSNVTLKPNLPHTKAR